MLSGFLETLSSRVDIEVHYFQTHLLYSLITAVMVVILLTLIAKVV